jgi:hypothetical protein
MLVDAIARCRLRQFVGIDALLVPFLVVGEYLEQLLIAWLKRLVVVLVIDRRVTRAQPFTFRNEFFPEPHPNRFPTGLSSPCRAPPKRFTPRTYSLPALLLTRDRRTARQPSPAVLRRLPPH